MHFYCANTSLKEKLLSLGNQIIRSKLEQSINKQMENLNKLKLIEYVKIQNLMIFGTTLKKYLKSYLKYFLLVFFAFYFIFQVL
jgi:hypothetical protein